MLSFTPYIFSVIAMVETIGLYVTGLYGLFCRDCLTITRLEIKEKMAFIVNKSETRIASKELFSMKGEITLQRHTVHAASLMLLQPLQKNVIFTQMMMVNKRLLYEIVHISAEVFLLS